MAENNSGQTQPHSQTPGVSSSVAASSSALSDQAGVGPSQQQQQQQQQIQMHNIQMHQLNQMNQMQHMNTMNQQRSHRIHSLNTSGVQSVLGPFSPTAAPSSSVAFNSISSQSTNSTNSNAMPNGAASMNLPNHAPSAANGPTHSNSPIANMMPFAVMGSLPQHMPYQQSQHAHLMHHPTFAQQSVQPPTQLHSSQPLPQIMTHQFQNHMSPQNYPLPRQVSQQMAHVVNPASPTSHPGMNFIPQQQFRFPPQQLQQQQQTLIMQQQNDQLQQSLTSQPQMLPQQQHFANTSVGSPAEQIPINLQSSYPLQSNNAQSSPPPPPAVFQNFSLHANGSAGLGAQQSQQISMQQQQQQFQMQQQFQLQQMQLHQAQHGQHQPPFQHEHPSQSNPSDSSQKLAYDDNRPGDASMDDQSLTKKELDAEQSAPDLASTIDTRLIFNPPPGQPGELIERTEPETAIALNGAHTSKPKTNTSAPRNKMIQCTLNNAIEDSLYNSCIDDGECVDGIGAFFADISKERALAATPRFGLAVLLERFERRRKRLSGSFQPVGVVGDLFDLSDDEVVERRVERNGAGAKKRRLSKKSGKKKKDAGSRKHSRGSKDRDRASKSEGRPVMARADAFATVGSDDENGNLSSGGGSSSSDSDSDEIDELDERPPPAAAFAASSSRIASAGNHMKPAKTSAPHVKRSQSSSSSSGGSSSSGSSSSGSSSGSSSSDSSDDNAANHPKLTKSQSLNSATVLSAAKSMQQTPTPALLSKLAVSKAVKKVVTPKPSSSAGSSSQAKTDAAGLSFGIVPKKPRARMWTLKEDYQLVRAVRMYGNVWDRVEAKVEGRNKKQCQDHWNRILSKKAENLRIDAVNIALQNSLSRSKGGADYQEISDEDESAFRDDASATAGVASTMGETVE
ncbi:hypothetical protein BJ741DRAFT_306608 [Chytriomyces cf. hyalinus JEL632]|nr:hypothetical protein BJ741DRAFT_306608 [Chytriomyces cf. hyalinus JEL632]